MQKEFTLWIDRIINMKWDDVVVLRDEEVKLKVNVEYGAIKFTRYCPVNVDFGEVFIAPFFETVVLYENVPAQPIANDTLGVEVQLSKEEQNRV
uniref:Uncharacterized protein n=1 Tax=Tanacetum cinerariifolium TaxID=118510 RepID=A0A699TNT9_TANCI|nr:hypothetical protein [Tanacetum cinerariifolium]